MAKKRTLDEAVNDVTTDLIKPPYRKSEKAAAEWDEVLKLLAVLRKEGKCEYTADDTATPYVLHAAQIHWKFDDYGEVVLNTKEMADIFARCNDLIFDEDNHDWWQISRKIYYPAE